MKKLMLVAVFAFGTLTAVNAQETKDVKETQEVQKEPTAMNQTPVKAEKPSTLKAEVVQDYKEVAVAEVPQAVTDAVAKQFAGSKLTKAWLNEKGEYKLEVVAEGTKPQTVYANSKGEWIKKNM